MTLVAFSLRKMLHITEDNPADHDGRIDNALKLTIKQMKKIMTQGDDDAIVFFTGDTGTGKSTLMFDFIEEYAGSSVYDSAHITFSLEQYAEKLEGLSRDAHDKIEKGQSPVGGYVGGDEFDYEAIENQTKQNKGLSKIFNVIRLHQIMQALCWPELERIPRSFLKNRVKLIFVTDSKDESNRTYIMYSKEGVRRMINDGVERLDVTTLTDKKIVEKYAALVGWFKAHENIKNKEYVIAKSRAVLDRVSAWNNEIKGIEPEKTASVAHRGETTMNLNQAADYLGVRNIKDLQRELFRLAKLDKVDLGQVYRGNRWYLPMNVIELVSKEGGCVRVQP